LNHGDKEDDADVVKDGDPPRSWPDEVIAHTSGAATATTTVPVAYTVPASGWYVNVHHGPNFTDADYSPSDSCGDLSAA